MNKTIKNIKKISFTVFANVIFTCGVIMFVMMVSPITPFYHGGDPDNIMLQALFGAILFSPLIMLISTWLYLKSAWVKRSILVMDIIAMIGFVILFLVGSEII